MKQILKKFFKLQICQLQKLQSLAENIYRSVNIALVTNEMISNKLGSDIYEIINAAKTKTLWF